MEQDGRAYYLDNAEKTSDPALKKVLLELADDELKHYNIFKAMAHQEQAEYKEEEKTTILTTVKNVFEQMKAEGKDFTFADEASQVWEKAREIEKESEKFYREQAEGLSDENQKRILNRIADEEHRHWVTMEQVLQFLHKPKQWLEDAEWSRLEE
jgi:rubrerythrin